MITIRIGSSESTDIRNVSWIHEQIHRRKKDGTIVCVSVRIDEGQINLNLTTPGCPPGRGGRVANDQEKRIIELWDQHHLNSPSFNDGNLVAFLKQLSRWL